MFHYVFHRVSVFNGIIRSSSQLTSISIRGKIKADNNFTLLSLSFFSIDCIVNKRKNVQMGKQINFFLPDMAIQRCRSFLYWPLLFNLYINDLFLMVTDTAVYNFADDTTIFAADCQLDKVLERLDTDALILSKWFPENFMKLNAGKCHLLTFGTNQDDIKIKIGEAIVEESSEEKLLGVIKDTNLNFKSDVSNLCKRASQKLHALARVSPFMGSDKLRLLMNSFIKAQFSYCPIIWMFHDCCLNAKVNKIHERALRIVYKDSHADYELV